MNRCYLMTYKYLTVFLLFISDHFYRIILALTLKKEEHEQMKCAKSS